MKKFFLEEKISPEYKNKVFQAVALELAKNRKARIKKRLTIWIPALTSLVVAIVVGLNYVQKNVPFFESEPNVVLFPTHDVEFFENMDVLEHLDDIQNMDVDTNSQEDSI